MMDIFKDLAVRKFITEKNGKQFKCSVVGRWLSNSSVENFYVSIKSQVVGICLVTWVNSLCSLKPSLHGQYIESDSIFVKYLHVHICTEINLEVYMLQIFSLTRKICICNVTNIYYFLYLHISILGYFQKKCDFTPRLSSHSIE